MINRSCSNQNSAPLRLCVMTFLFTLCLLCAAPVFSQSTADEIEMLLSSDAVTYAQAARFLLEASDAAAISDPEAAFRYAAERNWLPKKTSADDTARLDSIALLLMRSFDIKGGILYSITKSPHYAYREFQYQRIIHGRADPGMKVSGELLLYLTSHILSRMEHQ